VPAGVAGHGPGTLFGVPDLPPINLKDFEALARERLDRGAFDYFAGGAEDERTLAENCRAFERVVFRPRMLVDTSLVDTSTTIAGRPLAVPIMLAPAAFNRLGHPDGELAAARAAGAAGTIMCCSTMASYTLEEIAAVATGPLWFQVYVFRDREVTRDLVRRAEAVGVDALVLTVDTPRLGHRERDVRNRFVLPADVQIRNLEAMGGTGAGDASGDAKFTDHVHRLFDTSLTWEAVTWLTSLTKKPVFIKGVLTREDAALAIDSGAAGILVSNHGGRQLDGARATLDALPEVVEEAGGRVPVLLDGGIRRGTDVLKALALGAAVVGIGRPYLWGLTVAGEAGVRQVLELLRKELELAMALSGAPRISAISRALVARAAG
jgi:isopentenyl diphosphate isomerase/L-lactate dehydrogenase-like FMN-dependent dehydrogenase